MFSFFFLNIVGAGYKATQEPASIEKKNKIGINVDAEVKMTCHHNTVFLSDIAKDIRFNEEKCVICERQKQDRLVCRAEASTQ